MSSFVQSLNLCYLCIAGCAGLETGTTRLMMLYDIATEAHTRTAAYAFEDCQRTGHFSGMTNQSSFLPVRVAVDCSSIWYGLAGFLWFRK